MSSSTKGLTLAFFLAATPVFAAEATPPSASEELSGAERLNVDTIKEKYWARGDESELGVVQNRIYSKAKKIEFGIYAGFLSTDPFLSVYNLGGSVGYHFNEYFALRLLGWKSFVQNSSAYNSFVEVIKAQNGVPVIPYTNEPRYYYGTEASASILYGKLSLIGKSIIYFDMHLLGGVGLTGTENGSYVTPSLGLGQQAYLNKNLSVTADYRAMYYHETIVEKRSPDDQGVSPTAGQAVGPRNNFTHSITIGISFLFGISSEKSGETKVEQKK